MPSSAHERIIDDLCKNQGFKMISGEITIETHDPEEYIEKLKSGHRVVLRIDNLELGFMRVVFVEREEQSFSYVSLATGKEARVKAPSVFTVTLEAV